MNLYAKKNITEFLTFFVLIGTIFLFSVPLIAQETAASKPAGVAGANGTAGISLEQIESALAAIEVDKGIEVAVKNTLRPKYKQAIEMLQASAGFVAQAAEYRAAISAAPDSTAELQAELKALPSAEVAAGHMPTGDHDDLQKGIHSQQAAFIELKSRLLENTNELTRITGRPFEISSRLPENQHEQADVRKQLASPLFAKDQASPSRTAEKLLLQADQARLLSERSMLEHEQLSQLVREELLQAKIELLQRKVENAATVLDTLKSMAAEQLTSEEKRVRMLGGAIPKDLPEADEAVQLLVAEVQSLAEEFGKVARTLKQVKAAQGDLVTRSGQLTSEYQSFQEQLKLGGGGQGTGQALLDLLRGFPEQRIYVEGLITPLPALDEARLALLQVKKKLRSQAEVEARFSGYPSESVAELVSTHREVLEELDSLYGVLTRTQAVLDGERGQYLDKLDEFEAYASEQLFGFGMRSAPPVSVGTLLSVPGGLWWVFKAEHWVEFGRVLRGMFFRIPILTVGMLFAVTLLVLMRRRIRAALKQTGVRIRRISTDHYMYTIEAVFWTVLLVLPFPLLIGFLGWALDQPAEYSAWMRGVIQGLQVTAEISFGLAFLAAVCQPAGLGIDHFRWQEQPLTHFRRAIHLFALGYIPAFLITYSCLYEETSNALFGAGRLSFMLAHAWMAFVLWRLFHFSEGILANPIREHPNGIIARWRYLWFLLILALPVSLVVISGLGYIITAVQLSIGLLTTAAVLAAGVLLYRLTRRWFRMKQRKFALVEALARRRVRHEVAAKQEPQEQSADVITVDIEGEAELDLVSISTQTVDMLRLLFSLGVAAVILYLWSETFPVGATLESILVPLTGGVTLLALIQSVLIAIVTYIAVLNLPGMLELAVLRATSIEAGTRNAIITLFQYAVFAIGLSLLLNVLHVDWAKMDWIAAALSVGIGFGLQEVVANFVCGLIVLFERPIRVGDVVTVDGMTGTVTKIRIRATTITNGERQEYLVPNKKLITSSVLNWTLNAKVNRITIRFGVACDTDPDKALQIMLDVATDHRLILDNPGPIANFEAFGPSALNLVLFAYLPTLDGRSSTISALHSEINRRFAAVGITIPNPQFDLHLYGDAAGNS